MNITLIIILILIALFILWYIRRHFKTIKLPSVYLISGAVKTGKTLLSIALAVKQYKKNLRMWHIKSFFCKLFHKKPIEKPMLYSNIKLRYVKYNLLTLDIILRKNRMPYKSVVLIDEASLLADSMLYNDKFVNESLMLFYKLFAHETCGGTCVINTQSILDLHFATKRCVGQYLYIHSRTKVPFITMFQVRELMFNDESTMNVVNDDMELSLRKIFCLNRYYKYYDCYCYSIFTDNLPIYVDYGVEPLGKKDSLKTCVLVTLQDFKSLKEFTNNETK